MSQVFTPRETIPESTTTLTQMLIDRVKATPTSEAFRIPNASDTGWDSFSWQKISDDATKQAAGLISLGLELEDRVGLASSTNLNWVIADFAVALAGGALTTVYSSTGAEDAAYILADSGSRVLYAEDQEQLDKITAHRDELPGLMKVIMFEGDGDGDFVIGLDELRGLGEKALADNPDLVKDRAASVKPEHLSTLIYTSGTTGKPKGVELTHSTWAAAGAGVEYASDINIDDVQFLWLPLAHVFGSVLITAQLQVGFSTAIDGRVPKIIDNLPVIKPTMMAAVPRIFEKVYAAVNAQMDKETGAKKAIADWAFKTGKQYAQAERSGGAGGMLKFQHSIADKLVFSKIRDRMGGRLRLIISGSAALSKDVSEWFNIIGLPIIEGYGLTETTAMGTIVRVDNIQFGTVGEVVPGMELKIADDGEILLRGGGIMRGYHNNEEATAEVFAPGEGWFATGDIGEVDATNCLKITDRKKDLVKTSGGKYIAPSAIEAQLKAKCGLIGNVIVHANNRNFASALITLDPDSIASWAEAHGKPNDTAAAAKDPDVLATLQTAVDTVNGELNRWETIKKFEVLDHDLTIESGELTASLKVKRKVVEDHYSDVLDSMYD